MKRRLVPSPTFLRASKRAVRKVPQAARDIEDTLERLAENAFDVRLHSHKLKGQLAGLWACSASFDLRIIFEFAEDDKGEAIVLHTVGSHEEVN